MKSNLRVIVDKKCPDQDIHSFKGHDLAVRAGSKVEEYFLNETSDLKNIPIYSCGSFEMAKIAFIKGYAGALADQEIVLNQIVKNNSNLYRFLGDSLMDVDLAVAFRKNDTSKYYKKINDAIKEMKKDGTLNKILKKYGYTIDTPKGESNND